MKVSLCWKCKEAPDVINHSVTKTRMYLLVVILNQLPFSFMKCLYIPPSVLFFVCSACVWTALRAVLWNSVCFVFLL